MFGDNPSGRAFGWMGQIHMGRESLFTALVTCFTADQLPLLREAIDARRCHDEVGVGTLTGAAAAYWPDPKCRGGRLSRRLV